MSIDVLIVEETLPKSETIAGDLSIPVVECIVTHSAPGVSGPHFQTTLATPSRTASNQSICSFSNNNEIIATRKYGNYSDVLPLKAARRDSINSDGG